MSTPEATPTPPAADFEGVVDLVTTAATTKYTYDTTLTAYENVASFLFKMQCALGSRTKPAPEETAAEDEPAAEPAAGAAV